METITIRIICLVAEYALTIRIICLIAAYVLFSLFIIATYLKRFTNRDHMIKYFSDYNEEMLEYYKSGGISKKDYKRGLKKDFDKEIREAEILAMVLSPIFAIPCAVRLAYYYVRHYVFFIYYFFRSFND